MYVYDFQ